MNTPLKTATITFTSEEARVLLQLIDLAIKAQGINVSEVGTFLYKKINSSFEEPKLDVVLKE